MDTMETKRWLELLPTCIAGLNSRRIPGTDYAPRDINGSNVAEYLRQRWGVEDYHSLFNTATINARRIGNARWLRRMFRFQLGDRVLVSLRTLGRRGPFHKSSASGNFGKEPYTVVERFLATSRDLRAIPGGEPRPADSNVH